MYRWKRWVFTGGLKWMKVWVSQVDELITGELGIQVEYSQMDELITGKYTGNYTYRWNGGL